MARTASQACPPGNPANNIVMHVNKYVHPSEKIPNLIKPVDLKTFSEDYSRDDSGKIRQMLIEFDKNIIELLFGGSKGKHSRVRRFQRDYLPEDGYDSEEENDLAYQMFMDDVK
jgi:hypothetical protein